MFFLFSLFVKLNLQRKLNIHRIQVSLDVFHYLLQLFTHSYFLQIKQVYLRISAWKWRKPQNTYVEFMFYHTGVARSMDNEYFIGTSVRFFQLLI